MVDKKKNISKKKKSVNPKTSTKKQIETNQIRKKSKQADDKSARIQKNKKIKKIISWTSLLAVFIGISIFLCTSEMFKICNIEIKGSSQVSQETILLLSELKLGENIFLTNTTQVEKRINTNPYMQEVKLKRVLPDKIQIEIVEKQKTYIIEFNGMYAYIDKNGYILETSTNKLDNLIKLQGYSTAKEHIAEGNTLCEEDLEKLEDLEQILKSAQKNEISDKIDKINIEDVNNYILNMSVYRKIVHIGNTSNLTTKMLRTKDILDKTMNLEGKIFVNGNFNDGFDPYFREEINN